MADLRWAPLRRVWIEQAGQSLALSLLWLSLVSILALGAVCVALMVSARAGLSKAAAAAALALVQQGSVSVTLEVSYTDYTCVADDAGDTHCTAAPGTDTIGDVRGNAFQAAQDRGFGPLPRWAADAGCVGMRWPGTAGVGAYRICTGARGIGASISYPPAPVLEQVAQQWLQANVLTDGALHDAHVTGVRVGGAGQVSVEVTARFRPALLMFRTVSVSETAWPRRP